MIFVRIVSITLSLLISLHSQAADFLHIGTSNTLALDASGGKEETAIENMRKFIKSETGFDNDIHRLKSWQELCEQLEAGKMEIGVFQGHEFAWAREKYPQLTALAISVNEYPYRYAHILVRQDNKAVDFAGLQGQSLALPNVGKAHLGLFVETQSQAQGKELKEYFAKIATPTNFEDAVDDVVDGLVQAVVVDRVGLEAYKRRKPGRFARLKDIARSEALPSPLVAFHKDKLDKMTQERFRQGLLNARNSEEGKRLLTLFKLTGFENLPADFEKVLAETRKAYPGR